jgi:uncharacterized protein (TIGR03435 family)
MHTLHRHLYLLLLRLHPAAFRNEFAREMALDFEDALHTYGLALLFLDVTGSLARQWSARILSGAPDPISAPRTSLLAGNYVMVHDKSFTPLELGRGLIAAATLLSLCLLALSAPPQHLPGLSIDYASSRTPETRSDTKPVSSLPTDESSGFTPAQSTAAALTLGSAGLVQTAQLKPELLLFHPSGPLLSYEVATIKPLDPNAANEFVKLPPGGSLSPLSIRRYIMNAYGAIYSSQVIGGPDWLNKNAYLIEGKVPDDLESALQKMTLEERNDKTRMMEQSLLADRFHLKAHFETRVLPVYELVPAKSGFKITAVAAPPERKPGEPPIIPSSGGLLPPGTLMTTVNGNGLRVLKGRAIKMQVLACTIGGDIGNRPIVDHTGFTGYFDITGLTWAPLGDALATSEPPGAPSLPGALEEKLGLRIVSAKDSIEVLVIDEIGRPTPN